MTSDRMTPETYCDIITRDLGTLQAEIRAYPSDAALWRTVPGIANSAGTLVLHLAGNLRHFIGAQLGDTGYVRDREDEFARRGVSREELASAAEDATADVRRALGSLAPGRLNEAFPAEFRGEPVSVGWMLLHLSGHLAYHLGQINYHRRMTASFAAESLPG